MSSYEMYARARAVRLFYPLIPLCVKHTASRNRTDSNLFGDTESWIVM